MVKHMKLMGVAGAILLVAVSAAVASNMGFKFTANMPTDDGVYDISIPLNHNYTDLVSFATDIGGSVGCVTPAGITSFNTDQGSCDWLTNPPSGCNRAYNSSESIRIVRGAGEGPCTGWIIVGSHNPGFVYNLDEADPSTWDISIPYHTTAVEMASLCSEITNLASVTRFNTDQSGPTWICNPASGNSDPIAIGQGYRVIVGAPTTWTPSHY